MFFKCKHPAKYLGVRTEETRQVQNEDFERVCYHLLCLKCGEPVEVAYSKLIGGVEAFMARGGVPQPRP